METVKYDYSIENQTCDKCGSEETYLYNGECYNCWMFADIKNFKLQGWQCPFCLVVWSPETKSCGCQKNNKISKCKCSKDCCKSKHEDTTILSEV